MKPALLRLYAMTLDEARGLVGDVPCERFAEQPWEHAKHPAWILGHLCIASSMITEHLGGDSTTVPPSWVDRFRPGSECAGDRSLYPTKAELLDTLARAHTELARVFDAATDERLNAPFPIEEYRAFFPTIADAAAYMMAHHEGYHLGQLSQWRRALDLPRIGF